MPQAASFGFVSDPFAKRNGKYLCSEFWLCVLSLDHLIRRTQNKMFERQRYFNFFAINYWPMSGASRSASAFSRYGRMPNSAVKFR